MILGVGAVLPAGLRAHAPLAALPDDRAGVVDGPDLGPWLKRKKDTRLLPRAAVLALPAAGLAMQGYTGDAEELGLFVAVGREPPDEGDAEASLAAMEHDGALDLERLRGEGRALYPPLLPLRTLPNMVLAHVAIQHGIRGENACLAGGPEAGRAVWAAAMQALRSGRCAEVLVGAAWSAVDLASARDRLRLGQAGPPGEGAIFVRVSAPCALPPADDAAWAARVGDVGPVAGLLGVVGPSA
jgi:3-oxoacyl-[acyl-carrier-protein] synthase II